MLGKPATFAVDVWAFGITLYEVIFGDCDDEERLTCSNADVEAVISGCLVEDPEKRMNSIKVAALMKPFLA